MTGLVPQRRLLFFSFVLTAVLVYLSVVMKWWCPPFQSTEGHIRPQDSKGDRNASLVYWPTTASALVHANQEEQGKDEQSTTQSKVGISSKQTTEPVKPVTTSHRSSAPKEPVKPTEADFIGDRYATDGAPPQTNCPSSIRRKVSKTLFADRFLENVPVLQWAKHFSQMEYQRLKHFPGAHGWGSVDIEVLNNSLAILNTSANWQMFDDWEKRGNRSQCIRCAVVGNGGILKGSKKGQEIDEHDYVFRTNGVIIKGFEEDVGTRTSFYIFSTNTLRNSLRSYAGLGYHGPPLDKETKYVFLPDHDRDYILMRSAATHTPINQGPEKSSKPPQYFGDDVTVEKFKMFHPDFIRYIRNRFLHSHVLNTRYKDIYRPSTGAVMLLAAVHTCDQVSSYGFMTPDFSKYSDHYYDKTPNQVHFYANHDLRMEMALWQQLHKEGLMKLFMHVGD